ncbi:MAG: hypothetical protein IJJ38_01675 [Lachnospiraceae bacterium]|nr:hypothetical protein [Lachnospiraceae bacterium]
MKLKEIAHIRTGDKGNTCNIAVVPYREEDYGMLKEKLTAERVRDFYSELCRGEVIRYDVDSICAFNFVLKDALGGGVTKSLAIDRHGKSFGMALLEMELE